MKVDEHQILGHPLLTEKSTALRENQNKVVFAVHRSANKPAIKAAVERILKVKVIDVNIINVLGKQKRMGRFAGRTSDWKKAVITLKPGEKLDLFEGA